MEVKLTGINSVKKRLSNGVIRVYHYLGKHRGATPLPGDRNSAEFVAAYFNAKSPKPVRPQDTLNHLFHEYRNSIEFAQLKEVAQKDYDRKLKVIENTFGDMPKAALLDRRTRGVFKKWRGEIAKKTSATAQQTWRVLALVLAWGHDNGLVDANPCAKGGSVYRAGNRRGKFWSAEQKQQFSERGPSYFVLAVLLGEWLGQRESDLIRIRWRPDPTDHRLPYYDGEDICLKQKKTGKPLALPIPGLVKAALDAAPRTAETILVRPDGQPWSDGQAFSQAFVKARKAAGIEGVVFHDLRRTAVVEFARSGCTEIEIASITGHSIGEVKSILRECYVDLEDKEIRRNAMRKREARLAEQRQLPERPAVQDLTAADRGESQAQTGRQTGRVVPFRRNFSSFEDQWVG